MKITRMAHKVQAHKDGSKLIVRGTVHIGDAGHQLPFYYSIDPARDFDHEAHLAELERQGNQLVSCDSELRAWAGHKQTVTSGAEEIDVEITDCQMMFHAHSTWEVYVGWWETYEGQRSHHETRWPCKEPEHGPKLEEVQRHVQSLIQMRLGHYTKASEHRQTIDALAVKHGPQDQ